AEPGALHDQARHRSRLPLGARGAERAAAGAVRRATRVGAAAVRPPTGERRRERAVPGRARGESDALPMRDAGAERHWPSSEELDMTEFELADEFLPVYDVSDAVELVVEAEPRRTWDTLLATDLIALGRRRPLAG